MGRFVSRRLTVLPPRQTGFIFIPIHWLAPFAPAQVWQDRQLEHTAVVDLRMHQELPDRLYLV